MNTIQVHILTQKILTLIQLQREQDSTWVTSLPVNPTTSYVTTGRYQGRYQGRAKTSSSWCVRRKFILLKEARGLSVKEKARSAERSCQEGSYPLGDQVSPASYINIQIQGKSNPNMKVKEKTIHSTSWHEKAVKHDPSIQSSISKCAPNDRRKDRKYQEPDKGTGNQNTEKKTFSLILYYQERESTESSFILSHGLNPLVLFFLLHWFLWFLLAPPESLYFFRYRDQRQRFCLVRVNQVASFITLSSKVEEGRLDKDQKQE